jgi:hypothetical protein
MIKIAISCYMSQTFWTANEFRPETKTRTLPTIDAKPESENRQSVCRRSAKKQDPPHRQETHRLAQTKPTVSTQSRCRPSAILFSCNFPVAPKLGRRAPIAKFTYCRHSRKIPARPSDRRAPQKITEPTEVQLGLAPVVHPKRERIAHVWALEVQTDGLVPSPNPRARALVLFEFCDAPFNDLGEAYWAAFLLRGLV